MADFLQLHEVFQQPVLLLLYFYDLNRCVTIKRVFYMRHYVGVMTDVRVCDVITILYLTNQ